MAITVGLDFGTHQTKICIENSDSPLHKTYEFYEWEEGVYAFPSIIQINKDHTIRYGSIDLNTCLVARKKKIQSHPGNLILPTQPLAPKISEVEQCSSLKNKTVEQYKRLVYQYEKNLKKWEIECERIRKNYAFRQKQYEDSLIEYPLIYRYFKQATFSAYIWDYEIKPQDLTVLYLAYIIFRLEERFGTDFSIQMGIPASKLTFNRLKPYASGYLIQAIRLVEEIFKNDFEKFLSTPYEELLSMIPKYEYSEDLKTQYGLIILPEAYAALRSLTANSRIPRGMSIMLDIGGGTTDISFFVIEDNGEPHIYHFESINKGLNFFIEYEDRHNFKTVDFSKKKELEEIPLHIFHKAFNEFKGHIDKVIKDLTDYLHKDTISRGFIKSAFRDAVSNRPAIYTGGGCYDSYMRKSILDFSDVIYIDKKILGIPNVVNETQVTIPYSLMSTAFGLSIQRLDDEITVSNKEDLFAKYTNVNEEYSRWKAHREHGMYED
ncbi:MAG: hypothetical protein K2M45_00835 [Muribaculaceae bacterium]|nr:hypothetical protein [Muribaculaceae bacterium]